MTGVEFRKIADYVERGYILPHIWGWIKRCRYKPLQLLFHKNKGVVTLTAVQQSGRLEFLLLARGEFKKNWILAKKKS